MSVIGLEHVNLRVSDPSKSIGFFRDVLQMKVVPGPGATSTDHGAWVLDAAGVPVIHIGPAYKPYPMDNDILVPGGGSGTGVVHHLALNCDCYEETRNHLDQRGLKYAENFVEQISLRQIFVTHPDHILLELNFYEAERRSVA